MAEEQFTSNFTPKKPKTVDCTTCLGAAYFSLARQMGNMKPMCVGVTSTERLEIPESDGSEKAGRITVDDDFHCLGYSVSVPGAFPVCVRGIQSVTEKAIMGPEGRRLDIEYDRVAAIVGSGKARNMGQVSAVEVVSLKWRDKEDYF